MADYDKQYEEDLERAQALSLESLALEQFKNKRLQELNKTTSGILKTKGTTVSRASSMNESDSTHLKFDRQQSKSRPRPDTGSGRVAGSLIAPPPTSQRRSSSSNSINDSPDLISFASPPAVTASTFPTADIIDFCKQTSYANNQIVPIQQSPAPFMKMWSPNILPVFPASPVNLHQPAAALYQGQSHSTLASNHFFQGNALPAGSGLAIQQNSNLQSSHLTQLNPMFLRQSSPSLPPVGNSFTPPQQQTQTIPPVLPPKNQQRPPPPIPPQPSSTLSHSKSKKLSAASKADNNLIDLAPSTSDNKHSVRVSILQEFDPILSDSVYNYNLRTISPECIADDASSVCESCYDSYDPYDIYTGSGSNSMADPIYATVVKAADSVQNSPAPPVPPKSHMSTLDRRLSRVPKQTKFTLLDNIKRSDRQSIQSKDSDLKAFYTMVYNVRNKYRYKDPNTNMGLIVSPMVKYEYPSGLSIKLCVHPDFEGADFNKPLSFTCDVTTSVEHITLQLTCDLEAPNKDNYTLKVWGYNEYLVPTTLLSDYEYVHNCIKLDEDVMLILIPDRKVDKSFARTQQDDNRDKSLTFEDVVPNDLILHITYDNLNILLETVDNEIQKFENAALSMKQGDPAIMPDLQPKKVIQSLKCVINLMGNLYTLDVMEAVDILEKLPSYNWNYSIYEVISSHCAKIRMAIQNLIEMYCKAFTVDFEMIVPEVNEPAKNVGDISDHVVVRVCGIYRPSNQWNFDYYSVVTQIYYGNRPVGRPVSVGIAEKTENNQWPSRIIINNWFSHDDVPINSLAREARLVIIINGLTKIAPENDDNNQDPILRPEEIGWASIQFFDYEGRLTHGSMLLSIWPKENDRDYVYGPAPAPGTYPVHEHPMIGIEIAVPENVIFPDHVLSSDVVSGDFNSLDELTQQQLNDYCERDMLNKIHPDEREILWDKRHYLYRIPEALPKVLLAAHSWAYSNLTDLHGMLQAWDRLEPLQSFQLLLPLFPDMEVRKKAVEWIKHLRNDELVDFLPQLVVALRHETYENSALAQFLLDSALKSPRFAHHLFWLLSHNLPGALPQNYASEIMEKEEVTTANDLRHLRRMKLMLRALLAICGESLRMCFLSQQLLVKNLNEIADEVKNTKESYRMTILHNSLGQVNLYLKDNPTSLPLAPTLRVTGVQIESCSYFPSFTLPLKINFLMNDSSVIPAIYKVGDDLQQDMLTLQMVRLMDKLWLNEGLDLKIVAFNCVPTGKKKGMIEMVTKAETLRKIQVEHGLTGSFKDKPISEWLAKHNPSELEYARAVENFTASCAGYCVVTYILGICDRHNDNIMLKTSGHLFHIDFGKFLGDAQMFGNFKRDRAPFVLTSDMAYVINGGDRPTEKFHRFVDLCCQAFNIIRNHRNLFLYLFTLMASSGICGVNPDTISYLHHALLPGFSNPEAAAYFARLIESSLKSWFTQFNFFLHNLAQLKFSNDNTGGSLLSFVPKVYSKDTDGRIITVDIVTCRKRYDPHKYYVYILRVEREGQKDAMEILRTYKEFCELHQKLCIYFPLGKLYSLSTGLNMGRSNIKQVADKRCIEIKKFLQSLFLCAPEICHSDLVYTFFHPLLRDQQFPEEFSKKVKDRTFEEDTRRIKGQLKLSLQYSKGVFGVMVHHVRGLPLRNGQEPSTYVKVYLHPDDKKSTKRKTKVVRKNCHPSFMEMLEYRLPMETISGRILKATVWYYDALQENEFMGGVTLPLETIDLTTETSEWYPLENLTR